MGASNGAEGPRSFARKNLFALAPIAVWLLLLCLVVLSLRAHDWRTLDETGLVLLGFLVGLSLVPFVSQFRLLGVFEFQKKLEHVEEDLSSLRNEVVSLTSLAATQNAAAELRQQIIITTASVEREAVRVAELPAKSISEDRIALWDAVWWQFQLLVTLHDLRNLVEAEGVKALDQVQFDNIDERFKRGFDSLLKDEAIPDWIRRKIDTLALRVRGEKLGDHPKWDEFLADLMGVSTFLLAGLSYSTTLDRVIVAALTTDPAALPAPLKAVVDALKVRGERQAPQT